MAKSFRHDPRDDFDEDFEGGKRRKGKQRKKRRREPPPAQRTNDDIEYVDVPEWRQLDILAKLQGYFRKRSFQAMSYGALQECDRDFFESRMGSAAIAALPYFDRSKGVKLTTYLIQAVENFIIDDTRQQNSAKRKAITVPIGQDDYRAAVDKGLISEESLSDGMRGIRKTIFEMDYEAFQKALTPDQRYWLELRMQDISYAQIAEWAGYPLTSFMRNEWSKVQDLAREYGFGQSPARLC